jgi:hypothetical protein
MTDPPKKTPRPDTRRISTLLQSCVESNNRNYRLPVQKTSYKPQEQKSNRNDNERSSPKPLLDCLQPGPLLTSKPYEKSMSQRRRKNKPFNQDNLGRKIFNY